MKAAVTEMFAAGKRALRALPILTLLAASAVGEASAQYFRRPPSDLNPEIMQIDEKAVLGRSLDGAVEFVDQNGKSFRWSDLSGKPTLLVLSYYTCDGSCTIVNATLRDLLKRSMRSQPGADFNLVTVSFDRRDNLESTNAFQKHLELAGDLANVWTFATFRNEADLKAQTEKIGFKFFWSPPDAIFLHPGVFLFFSPEGRLARVLYQQDIDTKDVELAVLDARQGNFRPNEIVNYAVSLCYSYNYKDGKYQLSIPIIVGVGALLSGILTFAIASLVFRTRSRTQLRRA